MKSLLQRFAHEHIQLLVAVLNVRLEIGRIDAGPLKPGLRLRALRRKTGPFCHAFPRQPDHFLGYSYLRSSGRPCGLQRDGLEIDNPDLRCRLLRGSLYLLSGASGFQIRGSNSQPDSRLLRQRQRKLAR